MSYLRADGRASKIMGVRPLKRKGKCPECSKAIKPGIAVLIIGVETEFYGNTYIRPRGLCAECSLIRLATESSKLSRFRRYIKRGKV